MSRNFCFIEINLLNYDINLTDENTKHRNASYAS